MEDLITALKINFKVLFTQFIGFIVLFWLLKKFLFSRVLDLIQSRTDEIRGAYDANEKTRQEVDSLKLQYEAQLQEARKEAEAIVVSARERAEKAGQEVIEKTRQEAAQIRDRGLAEIEQEKKRVITEIRTDVVNLSVDIARKIIEKTVDAREAERLTDDVISKIGGVSL
ncbi:MAG: F0F1 ATP synthase subunit B [Deltaproteobacteria bacterium]|nr:F0F1 ATP synthase subunit B [Deltaproteobacteria bacterium]